jgi:stage II sporulation protein P
MERGFFIMQPIKFFIAFMLFLFILPILISQISSDYSQDSSSKEPIIKPVAFANEMTQLNTISLSSKSPRILYYFAHPEEAFKPITNEKLGVVTTSHKETNITSLTPTFTQYFTFNQIQADSLQVNVPGELQKLGLKYSDSYATIRPHIQERLKNQTYDLIIDFHRDAAKKSVTTVSHEEMNFARVAFVVGTKHKNYDQNLVYAQALHEQMNAIIPNISRGIMKKGQVGSNGIYNQDLAPNIILIELGGIDNTEEEIERTIAVISNAIAKMFSSEQL